MRNLTQTFGASGCTQGCAADEMHHGEVHTSSRDRFVARRPLGACAVETQTASLRCDRGNTVTDGWSGAFKFEDFVDGCEGLTAHEEVQSRSLMVFVEEYPLGRAPLFRGSPAASARTARSASGWTIVSTARPFRCAATAAAECGMGTRRQRRL